VAKGLGVEVGVSVGGNSGVFVLVGVEVNVAVLDGVKVNVDVGLFVGVLEGVNVNVVVGMLVAVLVAVGVRVGVDVLVGVAGGGVLVGPAGTVPPPKLFNKASDELASHKPMYPPLA
jgi:hypothetical protein